MNKTDNKWIKHMQRHYYEWMHEMSSWASQEELKNYIQYKNIKMCIKLGKDMTR
jgi:hypothetical protein